MTGHEVLVGDPVGNLIDAVVAYAGATLERMRVAATPAALRAYDPGLYQVVRAAAHVRYLRALADEVAAEGEDACRSAALATNQAYRVWAAFGAEAVPAVDDSAADARWWGPDGS